ncbi:hypothetical protein [Conexibacter sp. CPCC 206217]|uniref:hypothetical protein n=1 Tax=Conexibacter sp. CPCC 206217 TaxID=3064574 RepID=UPI002716E7CE|nr:hypothetical protein [Conexibacter sp. CPCC 206217]MDO8212593.1 hypothetical protein [Conexibacter sp. CPCC 206217]
MAAVGRQVVVAGDRVGASRNARGRRGSCQLGVERRGCGGTRACSASADPSLPLEVGAAVVPRQQAPSIGAWRFAELQYVAQLQ